MIRMTDFEHHDWPAGRSYLSMGPWQGERGSYREGLFRHQRGLVEVYEQIGDRGHTSLRFRWRGRDYYRSWQTVWGEKTLARLSRELVEAVAL